MYMMYIKPGACGTGSVDGRYWGIAIGLSCGIFIVAEIRKWIIYLFPLSFVSTHILSAW